MNQWRISKRNRERGNGTDITVYFAVAEYFLSTHVLHSQKFFKKLRFEQKRVGFLLQRHVLISLWFIVFAENLPIDSTWCGTLSPLLLYSRCIYESLIYFWVFDCNRQITALLKFQLSNALRNKFRLCVESNFEKFIESFVHCNA